MSVLCNIYIQVGIAHCRYSPLTLWASGSTGLHILAVIAHKQLKERKLVVFGKAILSSNVGC